MRDTWVRIAGASLRWTGLLLLAGLALRGKESLYYEWKREAPAEIGRPNLPNDPMPVHGIRLFPPQQPQIMPAADQAFTAILLGFESLEFLDPQRYWRGDPRARPNPLPHMKNGESPNTFIENGIICFLTAKRKVLRCRPDELSTASLNQLDRILEEYLREINEELADGPQPRTWHGHTGGIAVQDAKLIAFLNDHRRTKWGRFPGICYPREGTLLLQDKDGNIFPQDIAFISFPDRLYLMVFEHWQQRRTAAPLPELVAAEQEGLPKLLATIRTAYEAIGGNAGERKELPKHFNPLPAAACSYQDLLPEYDHAMAMLEAIVAARGVAMPRKTLQEALDRSIELADPMRYLMIELESQRMGFLKQVPTQECQEKRTADSTTYRIERNGEATVTARLPEAPEEGMVCWKLVTVWKRREVRDLSGNQVYTNSLVWHRMVWDEDEHRWCFRTKAERDAFECKFPGIDGVLEKIRQGDYGKPGDLIRANSDTGCADDAVHLLTPALIYRRYAQFVRGMDWYPWPLEPKYDAPNL